MINPVTCLQSLEFLSADVPFHTVVSFPAVALTVICSVVMIVLACWLPALKAARMTPIQAIRQPQKREAETPPSLSILRCGEIVGHPGGAGLSKISSAAAAKPACTILSLAVSLILFTTVTSVMTMMIQAVGDDQSG